jgi:quinol monooxygenase YgiN
MIKVVAKHYVKSDKLKEYLEQARPLVEATVQENGCIKYELFEDVQDPTILTMIEEWVDKDALNKHMASEHFLRIVPILGKLIEKPTEINLYKKAL